MGAAPLATTRARDRVHCTLSPAHSHPSYIYAHYPCLPPITGIPMETLISVPPLDLMSLLARSVGQSSMSEQHTCHLWPHISRPAHLSPVLACAGWGSIWPPAGVRAPRSRVSLRLSEAQIAVLRKGHLDHEVTRGPQLGCPRGIKWSSQGPECRPQSEPPEQAPPGRFDLCWTNVV